MDVVVGGGVAGLMRAWALASMGRDVTLFEAAPRVGGAVRTRRIEGAIVELGPQSLRLTRRLWGLVGRLGLTDQVVPASPAANARFLWDGTALQRLPDGPLGVALAPWGGWRRAASLWAETRRPASRGPETASLGDWVRRRFGPGWEDVLAAGIGGVFGGDPDALDAVLAAPGPVAWERAWGSVLRGAGKTAAARAVPDAPASVISFREGMQALPDALAGALGRVVRCGVSVTEVRRQGHGWRVETTRGGVDARRLHVAVPPDVAAAWFGDLPVAPCAPVASVHLGWPREAGDRRGFGWLAAPSASPRALGGLWVTSTFPGHAPGQAVVRVMLGGARDPALVSASEEALVEVARDVVAKVEGRTARPAWVHVARHRPGIPQPPPGHSLRLAAWESAHPQVAMLGWGWRGPGVSTLADEALSVLG
jgi:oxygen-dependent protoporphyrinogen oxidase